MAWLALITLPFGCNGDEEIEAALKALGEGCLIDSDCEGELVCVFRRCHVQCETTKDCLPYDPTTRCVIGDRPTHVCLLPDELYCGGEDAEAPVTYHSDCLPGMYCGPDGTCRDSCASEADCIDEQVCAKGVCADDDELPTVPALTDTAPQQKGETCSYSSQCLSPLVCRDGLCAEECLATVDCPDGQTCVTVEAPGFDTSPRVCVAPAALCSDGAQNGDETDVDCGGSCAPCADGGACAGATDCASKQCTDSTCAGPSCSDAVQNGDETGVDCGGACVACPAGGGCIYNSDCLAPLACKGGVCDDPCVTSADCPSGQTCEVTSTGMGDVSVCVDGSTEPTHCSSATQDGDETDVDCGGSCGPCPDTAGCAVAPDCTSGVCTANQCTAPSCTDGVLNGDETSLDCGGATCGGCDPGQGCLYNSDCASPLACLAGTCGPACVTTGDCPPGQACVEVTADVTAKTCLPSGTLPGNCLDGTLNGDETAIDCGGSCAPCPAGQTCAQPTDCDSAICTATSCEAATCTDTTTNGDETDVDCGGSCPAGCALGQSCTLPSDCEAPLTCTGGICAEECQADVDCTGAERCIAPLSVPYCSAPLPSGSACSTPSDCASGVCTSDLCTGATCSDGVKNGNEINVDCGGSCAPCTTGQTCTGNGDCATNFCQAGLCTPATCGDSIANGDETAVDCGGSCAPCPDGATCFQASDCQSFACANNQCATATCSDGVKNGNEGDVDCGGSCAPCGVGAGCNLGADCGSLSCSGNICQAPTCSDGVQNGFELGVDCGDSACGLGCPAGTPCTVDDDCTTGTGCRPGAAPTCTVLHDLTIASAGTGLGLVVSNDVPDLVSGCADCTVQAFDGATVQLTDQPAGGSTFAGFSGAGCSGTGPCSVFMSGPQTVTATFDAVPGTVPNYTLDPGKGEELFAAMSTGGNVIFAGTASSSGSYGGSSLAVATRDVFVGAYDQAAGWDVGHQWSRVDGGAGEQRVSAAGEHAGTVLVFGRSSSANPIWGSSDVLPCPANGYFTARYATVDGSFVGATCLDGSGVTFDVEDHIVDENGVLWIVGSANGSGTFDGLAVTTAGADAFIIKVDIATGSVLQRRVFGTAVGDVITGVVRTANGAAVSASTRFDWVIDGVTLSNPIGIQSDDFMAFEVNESLVAQWGYRRGSSLGGEKAWGIARLGDDTLLLGVDYESQQDFGDGTMTPNAGNLDLALVHLSAGGAYLDVQHWGGPDDDRGQALRIAPGGTAPGSIYALLTLGNSVDFGTGPLPNGETVVRWSGLGTLAWTKQAVGGGSVTRTSLDDDNGELWLLGRGLDDWGLGTVTGSNSTFYAVRMQP